MGKGKRRQANAEFEQLRRIITDQRIVYCPLVKDYIDLTECRESGCEHCEEWKR